MTKLIRFFALLVVFVALSVQASIAIAAPNSWKSVDVGLQSEEQQSMLLVSGQLPDSAKLPAEVELAVPSGTQLQWIGEILGGDPSKDPSVKYSKSSSNGMDVYRFTLTRARVAQVEGTVPDVVAFDGTNYVTRLKWTAWQDIPEVRIGQRIPQGSQIVQASGGASIQPGSTGFSHYSKRVASAKAGDVLELSFSYAPPAGAATTNTTAGGSNSGAIVLAVITIIVVGAFGLLFLNVRRKLAEKTAVNRPTAGSSRGPVEQVTYAGATSAKKRKSDPEPVAEPATTKRFKLLVPTLIVVGALVLGVAIAGTKATSAAVVDGKITKNFGAASACQSGSVSIAAKEGVDLAKQGGDLLKAFQGMEGVGDVTVDIAQSKIDMAWCESKQSEASMREALSETGLVTVGQGASAATSAPAIATVAPSGEKQTMSVDTGSGNFSPSQIVLKAGVPAEITFGQASGCLSEVVINDLNIKQDLTQGPATVKLPALDAGTYAFACGMGHQSGQIVVQ